MTNVSRRNDKQVVSEYVYSMGSASIHRWVSGGNEWQWRMNDLQLKIFIHSLTWSVTDSTEWRFSYLNNCEKLAAVYSPWSSYCTYPLGGFISLIWIHSSTHQLSFLHTFQDHGQDLLWLVLVVIEGFLNCHHELVSDIVTDVAGRTD